MVKVYMYTFLNKIMIEIVFAFLAKREKDMYVDGTVSDC